MKILTILGIAICALALAVRPAAAELKVGDEAPDFQLKASDGQIYKLSYYRGKQAVVLAWFPRAFTGGCTAECKSMKENSAALHKFDVAYFTASTDSLDGPKGNTAFAESMEADYPILSDPDGNTAKAYGVYNANHNSANRVTFYIDREGKIAAIDNKIDTKNAGSDVVTKLKHLGVAPKQ
jgi:peroxiredoxin Q/BCP